MLSFKIMPHHMTAVHQSAPALLVPILLVLIVCCRPGQALCESRCERAVPDLGRLREVWHGSFRWVANRSITFEHFLLTLIRDPNDGSTRNFVLNIIARYEECMLSCEHQFSKRSTDIQKSQPLRSKVRVKLIKLLPRSRSRLNSGSTVYLLRGRHFVKM